MNIGIIGAGRMGTTLARKLQAHGHQVRLANSRGPESLQDFVRETGVTAVTVAEAMQGSDVIMLTIPFGQVLTIKDAFRQVPQATIVVETMNYLPARDGVIDAIEQGLPHSAWVAQIISHPVIKAFNTIGSYSLMAEGRPAGTSGRIALSVSGEDAAAKQTIIELVNQTGFDGYDAGPLADSWRQQPGTPAYCTNLTLAEAPSARAGAIREDAQANYDFLIQKVMAQGKEYIHSLVSGNFPDNFVDHSVDIFRAYHGLPPRSRQ
ncbi:NAD(P)-binding domain-containing protein [Spirosoma foliorum]|uniref:NAD(P)-binding domain-containing protein n=2 Tax=Spirosoma foliorum TaxID=2710596 RepID=A0A7G5H1E5_9BACT|nr:NAD(P)-binding domain-containing protein [Spirosoma foliorum]QMW04937.1 NAD(P)-binding domain-containing protein [Spirosoma foliorum]